jgi:hypothetical protein
MIVELISFVTGESAKQHDLLSKMMGESREENERRIQERLRIRRSRIADGMIVLLSTFLCFFET